MPSLTFFGPLHLSRFVSLCVFCCWRRLACQTSSSYSYQEQQRILGLFELTQEFKQQHYLTGLLLTELSAALDMESEGYTRTHAHALAHTHTHTVPPLSHIRMHAQEQPQNTINRSCVNQRMHTRMAQYTHTFI